MLIIALAQREGVAPAMLGDEEFGYSKTWRLSTSNVSTPWNACFNFGPVTDHCYGRPPSRNPGGTPCNSHPVPGGGILHKVVAHTQLHTPWFSCC